MERAPGGGAVTESRVSKFFRETRQGIFGTLFVLQRKVTSSTARAYFLHVILTTQMLHFVVSTQAGFKWREDSVTAVRDIVSFSTPAHYWGQIVSSPLAAVGSFYAAFAWVVSFVLLFVWATVSFIQKKFVVLWPLKVLRAVGTFSATVLYIPLLSLLLSGFGCGPDTVSSVALWSGIGLDCASPGFIVQSAIVGVFTIVFVGLCSLFTLVFHDADPLSNGVEAKVHGRVDFAFLLLRTSLVFFVDLFPGLVNTWFNVGVCSVVALLWLMLYIYLLPFVNAEMNRFHLVSSCIFAWAVVCLALSQGVPSTDAALQLYMGLPLAVVVGLYIHNWRVMSIVRAKPDALSSSFEVELKARFLVHTALWGHPTDRIRALEEGDEHGTVSATSAAAAPALNASVRIPAAKDLRARDTFSARSLSSAEEGSKEDDAVEQFELGGSTPAALRSSQQLRRVDSRRKPTGGDAAGTSAPPLRTSAGGGISSAEDDSDEREHRAERIRRLLPQSVVAEMHDLYRAAAHKFRSSALIHVFYSRFFLTFAGNRHMQMSHLLQAERRQPALDISFIAFQARKAAEDVAGGANQLSALARVTFEKHTADARKHVLRAGQRQLAFFTEILTSRPDLARLHRLSSEMNAASEAAEKSFTELFALNQQSLAIISLYTAFNQHVLCNTEKATLLGAEAERINEMKSKEYRGEGTLAQALMSETQLDIMGDATAVLTISASSRNFGLILSANVSTSKLFGFVRLQLERRPFFSLLPKPLDAIFERILSHYTATGEGDLGATRVVLGLHRNGHIFSCLLSIREAPPTDGPPTFIALMRILNTSDSLILLTSDCCVSSASVGALSIFGVESSDLSSGETHLSTFITNWDDVAPHLLAGRINMPVTITPAASRVRGWEDGDEDGGGSVDSSNAGSGDEALSAPVRHGSVARAIPSSTAATTVVATASLPASSYKAQLETVNLAGHAPLFLLRLSASSITGVAAAAAAAVLAKTPRQVDASRMSGHKRAVPELPITSIESIESSRSPSASSSRHSQHHLQREAVVGADALLFGPDGDTRTLSQADAAHVENVLSASVTPSARASKLFNVATAVKHSVAIKSPRDKTPRGGSGGGEDARSQSSRGSNGKRTMVRLRRLLSAPNPPLLSGLRLLRFVGIGITLLAVCLAAALSSVTQTAFTSYKQNLAYALNGASRIMANFNAIVSLEALIFNAKGWVPLSAEEELRMRAALVSNATIFQGLARSAYAYISTTQFASIYTDPTILVNVYDTPSSIGTDGSGEEVYMNLVDADNYFVLQMVLAANLSNAQLADDRTGELQYLLTNTISGGNTHETMSSTVGSGFDLSRDTARVLRNTQVVVFATMGCLIFSIIAFAFVPILLSIENAKDSITSAFVFLPLLVRLILQRTVERRMRSLQELYADELDEIDGANGAPDGEEVRVGNTHGVSGDQSSRIESLIDRFRVHGAEEGEDALDWERIVSSVRASDKPKVQLLLSGASRRTNRKTNRATFCCFVRAPSSAAVAPSRRSSGGGRGGDDGLTDGAALRKSPSSLLLLLARFLFPLFALFAYYCTLYTVSVSTLSTTLVLQAALVASGNRACCTRELLLNLRRNIAVYGDRIFMATRLLSQVDTEECVTFHQKLLQFGVPEGTELRGNYAEDLPPMETGAFAGLTAQENAQIFEAQNADACSWIASSAGIFGVLPGSLAQCQSFNAGFLRQGLSVAVNSYIKVINRLGDRRMRARLFKVPQDARTGEGVLLPLASYNYTADEELGGSFTAGSSYTLSGEVDLSSPFVEAGFTGDIDLSTPLSSLPNGTTYYSMAAEMSGPEMQFLIQADHLFLTPGLQHLVFLYYNAGLMQIEKLVSFITLFTVLFYVAFCVYIATVFIPQVSATNRDIIHKRGILLLLPMAVVLGTASLNKAVERIFAEDESLGKGSSTVDSHTLRAASKSIENVSQRMDDATLHDEGWGDHDRDDPESEMKVGH